MLPLHANRTEHYLPPLTPKLLTALEQGAAFRRRVSLHTKLPAGSNVLSPSMLAPRRGGSEGDDVEKNGGLSTYDPNFRQNLDAPTPGDDVELVFSPHAANAPPPPPVDTPPSTSPTQTATPSSPTPSPPMPSPPMPSPPRSSPLLDKCLKGAGRKEDGQCPG